MKWWLEGWKSIGSTAGRSRRRVYWWYTLGNLALLLLVQTVEIAALGDSLELYPATTILNVVSSFGGIILAVRRMHDIGKSGWWVLFGMIPLIGWITLFIFTLRDSEPGANEWGPNPKEPTRDLVEVF